MDTSLSRLSHPGMEGGHLAPRRRIAAETKNQLPRDSASAPLQRVDDSRLLAGQVGSLPLPGATAKGFCEFRVDWFPLRTLAGCCKGYSK
jgi:hypothetical protein